MDIVKQSRFPLRGLQDPRFPAYKNSQMGTIHSSSTVVGTALNHRNCAAEDDVLARMRPEVHCFPMGGGDLRV